MDCDVAPGFHINELHGEEEWACSPGQVAPHVHSLVLAIVHEPGSSIHCRLWVAVFVCGWSSLFFGWSGWWGGGGLLLALGIMLWLLLVVLLGCGSGWLKKGSDVTSCDISVMFKLTCEITCTISCDFLAVYSKNPSVLVQSLAEVKFSPQGWSQSCWAWVRPTCQLLPLKTTQAWQSLAELSRNYRGTIMTSNCNLYTIRRLFHGQIVQCEWSQHAWESTCLKTFEFKSFEKT